MRLVCWSLVCGFVWLAVLCSILVYSKQPHVHTWHRELTLTNSKALYPYIAAIVDDRATEALVRAVTNVVQHLPSDWRVQIITPYENWPFYRNTSLAPLFRDDRVMLTPLDAQRGHLPGGDFANFVLTSPSFWRQVQGDKVLLFQIDSVLCSNSSYKVTDFLQYDFVGAPWKSGGCCNGGLSLRDRTKILHMLQERRLRYSLKDLNEDGWFVKNLRQLGGHIAPNSVANTFAVETVYHPQPFAVHAPRVNQLGAEKMARLCRECPETRLISNHC